MNVSVNIIGQLSLFTAWLSCLLGFGLALLIAVQKRYALTAIAKNLCLLTGFAGLAALVILAVLFLQDDYSNLYVWQHSNQSMPWIYKITAVWGGMDGSMLLWGVLITAFSAIAATKPERYSQDFYPWLLVVMNSSGLFFLTVVLFLTNPFTFIESSIIPPEGNGLNPLLQNPYMAIHPPTLYLGFTAFAVPYAFALAALIKGETSQVWIQYSSRWTLIAWGFLTFGIVLGGHWAYLELGWGGFWAWDPVENSSFLPWLLGTAYLHSIMVQEKRGLLKTWNVILIVGTYGLTVFGTFLTRSGIVQSVHAFAKTDIGPLFLIYLGIIVIVTGTLLIKRKAILKAEHKLEQMFSREMVFLLNNLVLLSICFATFWGVMFPVFSEALTGSKQAIGIPFFNAINLPLFLMLLGLMSVGPFIAWRSGNLKATLKSLFPAVVVASVVAVILIWVGVPGVKSLLAYSLSILIIVSLSMEARRLIKRNRQKVFSKHRRRLAGYLVHIGVAVVVIGITASMSAKFEDEFSLAVGESTQVSNYTIELNRLKEVDNNNYRGLIAEVTALNARGKFHASLAPELRRYLRNGETTSEVAIKMSLKDDLYLVLAGLNEAGTRASFKVYINPLQIWLWFGVLIMVAGTLILVTDKNLVRFER